MIKFITHFIELYNYLRVSILRPSPPSHSPRQNILHEPEVRFLGHEHAAHWHIHQLAVGGRLGGRLPGEERKVATTVRLVDEERAGQTQANSKRVLAKQVCEEHRNDGRF